MKSYKDGHTMKFAIGMVKNAFMAQNPKDPGASDEKLREIAVYDRRSGKWRMHVFATDAPRSILEIIMMLCQADAAFCGREANPLEFDGCVRQFGYACVFRTMADISPDDGKLSGLEEEYAIDGDLELKARLENKTAAPESGTALDMSEDYPKALMGLMSSLEFDVLKNVSLGAAEIFRSDAELARPEYEYDIDVLNQAIQAYRPAFLQDREKPEIDYD